MRAGFALALLMLLTMQGLYAQEAQTVPVKPPRVLLVHSYHQGFSWTDGQAAGMVEGLQAELRAQGKPEAVVHHAYLENRTFPTKSEAILSLLGELYGNGDIDLILSTDDFAFESMRRASWRLRDRIPLVFSGVNDFDEDVLLEDDTITGVTENFVSGRIDTILAARMLFPDTRTVLFILDRTPTSQAIARELESIRPRFAGLNFRYVTEVGLEEQKALLARTGPGTVVVPVGIHRDAQGNLLDYESSMEALALAASVPCFGFIENRLGHGIVGGNILLSRDHGLLAGKMAGRILAGSGIGSIPVVMDNPGKLMFDWRQIKRFGKDNSMFPPESVFLFEDEPFWLKHRQWMFIGFFIGALLLALVLYLFLNRMRLLEAQKRVRKSEQLLSSWVENAPDPITVIDARGNYVMVNKSACVISGYTREELLRMNLADVLVGEESHPDRLSTSQDLVLDEASGKVVRTGMYRYRRKDGGTFVLEVSRVHLEGGLSVGISRDFSARLEAERRIAHALEEKETLIKELYHRTKNNMYVMYSLLALHGAEAVDPGVRSTYLEMTNRIQAMALVHERLYQSRNLTSIDLHDFIEDLIDLLKQSFKFPRDAVEAVLDLGTCTLVLETAVPLGLVINELIMNSFRHALGGNASGCLKIVAWREEDWICLTFEDNGPGFSPGFDPERQGHMGLQTVFTLVKDQLGGKITWKSGSGQGLWWQIRFPQEKK